MKQVVTGLSLIVTLFLALPASAEQAIKRTVLNQADLQGAAGMHVISAILDVAPGAFLSRHFHNGIEASIVLEGSMVQMPGAEPTMLATGSDIFELRNALHGGFTVIGPKPLRLFTVHIVDKGKPLMDGTQQQ
ncbi:MAG: quercetin dioxygenase-like cupin family protein [Halieaceae bacterium]|jgi:quercetin dioxygenase-like cupin family protein